MNQSTEDRLNNIEARLEKIEQEHFALWEIALAVTNSAIVTDDEGWSLCAFCSRDSAFSRPDNFYHETGCIVLKARALIAQNTTQ
jgi:hypothetical protein